MIRAASGKLSRLRFDRRVMVFIFFLVVSTVFWLLNVLGREYTTQLSYPVRYTNFPDDVVMVGELPSNLDLTVNAYGYTLLKHYIGRRLLPIVFDVNSFSLNRMPDTDTKNFYMLTSVAANRVTGQLGADIEVLRIEPDTLFFRFTDMISGRLPVKPVLEIQFEQQFMMKGNIVVEPDSVDVSGPAAVIDTMQFIPTITFRKTGVNKPVTEKVSLPEFKMLNLSVSTVLLNIPVEQFTEASLRIPVEAVNLPDTLIMKTFPSVITVSYMVALSDYDKVTVEQFNAIADYNSVPSGNGRLKVDIVKQPAFVRSVRFAPQFVDYIIEK